jgi:hypothetical protein
VEVAGSKKCKRLKYTCKRFYSTGLWSANWDQFCKEFYKHNLGRVLVSINHDIQYNNTYCNDNAQFSVCIILSLNMVIDNLSIQKSNRHLRQILLLAVDNTQTEGVKHLQTHGLNVAGVLWVLLTAENFYPFS